LTAQSSKDQLAQRWSRKRLAKPAGIAQNHLFAGSRNADFVTSWIQVLATPMAKGILGSADLAQWKPIHRSSGAC
jgi:hypothetical protein